MPCEMPAPGQHYSRHGSERIRPITSACLVQATPAVARPALLFVLALRLTRGELARTMPNEPQYPGVERLGRTLSVRGIVVSSMTVRADRHAIVDRVGAAAREGNNVVDFEEWLAVCPNERSLLTTSLTPPTGISEHPCLHCRVPQVGLGRSFASRRVQIASRRGVTQQIVGEITNAPRALGARARRPTGRKARPIPGSFF